MTCRKSVTASSFIIVISLLFSQILFSQSSPYVVEVRTSTANEGSPISVSVELTQSVQIDKVTLHYRQFGESEYQQVEMLMSGRVAACTLPAKAVKPPYIEYFIELQLAGALNAFFPLENPEGNPLKIPVQAVDPKDAEVRFLSPDPGETAAAEDMVVAISLMFASDAVDKTKTHLYIDDIDVTKDAVFSDDVILFNPNNVKRVLDIGSHSIKVELFDTLGNAYYTKSQIVNVSTSEAIEAQKEALRFGGNGQLEARNEKIDSTSTAYLRGDLHVNSTYHFLTFGGDLHITNEDKPTQQPQNRYLASLQAADILKLQFGDAYPVFPSLFVSGKRVRGITGSLNLGVFNVDASAGQINRNVEGTLDGYLYYADTNAAYSRPKNSILIGYRNGNIIHQTYVTGDTVIYQQFQSGTYARNFLAVRPSFGSGENFQLGFTFLKSKDDTASITYGMQPQENLVIGTDFVIAFDDQRFKWTNQVAFSESNIDISGGNWQDDDFKALGQGQSDSATTVNNYINTAKIARNFITVNKNIWPANPLGGTLPSSALESELTLNYLNNFVRAFAFRRGSAYMSFGNDFVQTDIMGINLSDRIRLFSNRTMLSVSYETKSDNTDHTSAPTNTFNTLNTSIGIYPGADIPTFSFGYGFNTRKNSLMLHGDSTSTATDSSTVANEITNRFYVSIGYDFTLYARHSLSLSMNVANKQDNTFNLRNQKNFNLAATVSTTYAIPLQTNVSLIFSHNATYQADYDSLTLKYLTSAAMTAFNYQTVSINARYKLLENKLSLFGTLAPSFGDFQRLLMQAGADYQVIENHYVVAEFDFIQNPGRLNDVIASLVYRFSF